MTGVLPGVVGATLMMLYWNLASAAASLVGKSCATTISLLSLNLPAAWHSAQALLSTWMPPGWRYGLIRLGRIGRRSEIDIVVAGAAGLHTGLGLPVVSLRRGICRTGRAVVALGAIAHVLREGYF